ncbi:hypothetical protein BC827DRAFT_1250926 [Russula dissimulans]|nr:hypothetical protein BC827DRAFT_1250926 [Russula dissimulans]
MPAYFHTPTHLRGTIFNTNPVHPHTRRTHAHLSMCIHSHTPAGMPVHIFARARTTDACWVPHNI